MREMTESEMLHRMAAYCSTAERCRQDIEKKITTAGLSAEAAERILVRLEKEKFLDETRFCRSFVNDKLRFNQWGRVRISYELKKKNIPSSLILEALDAMDMDMYNSILRSLLVQKQKSVKGKNKQDVTRRLIGFAASRGFTIPEIKGCLPAANTDFTDDDAYTDTLD